MSRPTEIQINLEALRNNCLLAQSVAPDSKTVAVVKADAYGHGAEIVTKALEPQVAMFAVSCLEEALILRQCGINKPILLLEGCFTQDEFETSAQQGVQMVVHNQEQLHGVSQLRQFSGLTPWLKIDTGMHRLGIQPNQTLEYYRRLKALPQVEQVVMMSHLASADSQQSDFTSMQLSRFETALALLGSEQDSEITTSVANSAGLLAWPSSRMTWNRPGIMLYGLSPFEQPHALADQLTPVMSFTSKVIAVREIDKGECVGYGSTWKAERKSRIATVAAGYGDGYPRNARSGTPVLINGQRGALAGRVSMDMISVDVTDIPEVRVNDHVELWGERLLANEVATWADSIGYELVTRMPKRTPRIIG